MSIRKGKLLKDFFTFARGEIFSWDVDPQFPLLKRHYADLDLDIDTALWWSLLYLSFYHFGSAEESWKLYPKQVIIKRKLRLPVTKNRRVFRGNDRAQEQLNYILTHKGPIRKWVESTIGKGGKEGWALMKEEFQSIGFNGAWSSYKWCDILKQVHGYNITAPNIGDKVGATAGPIPGLATLTGRSWQECAHDYNLHQELFDLCLAKSIPMNGLDQLESVLCNFQGLVNGRYYAGHDIDRDATQLLPESSLWKVRQKVFHSSYL
ncbi:hypothetical protein LCGC14_3119710, partial [marine sediment metagenome]